MVSRTSKSYFEVEEVSKELQKVESGREQLLCVCGSEFPPGGASIPPSLNGMVERMRASPTMDRILRSRKGLATATEFSGVLSALHTDLHKRLPDMG